MRIRLPFAGLPTNYPLQHLRMPGHKSPFRRVSHILQLCAAYCIQCPANLATETGAFFLLLLLAGYAGLTSLQLELYINDKVLHLLTFFALTVVFYWVVDTNRRRTLNLALVVCTGVLGAGSEFLQELLPNERRFDAYDLIANVVGSLAGLGLCSWYHRRMLERKRLRKGYGAVSTGEGEEGEDDVELGEGVGGGVGGEHESGIAEASGAVGGAGSMTLEEEVDNWDENAVDAWEEDDAGDVGDATASGKGKGVEANGGDHADPNRRTD